MAGTNTSGTLNTAVETRLKNAVERLEKLAQGIEAKTSEASVLRSRLDAALTEKGSVTAALEKAETDHAKVLRLAEDLSGRVDRAIAEVKAALGR
jgi:hypothetical protein